MIGSFAARREASELMDTEPVGYEDYRACLADLARVNRLFLAYRPTLAFLDRLQRTGRLPQGRPLVIADAGAGYGDMLRRIDAFATRRRLAVDLIGVDLNPLAARAAREATPARRPIRFITGDVFTALSDTPVDVVISSLFTHHLEGTALPEFLAWMEATATLGWFINDLHRHPLPYYGFAAMARAAGWHRFIRHDGPVSIARAFRRDDWQTVLAAAGIPESAVSIEWWLPFRLCLARIRR
jgi:SAM-dependent methyltransferase